MSYPQMAFAGFTDVTHGAAIATGTPRVLYRTSDGGHTWTPVTIKV